MRRKIISLCAVVLLILSCSLTALAQDFDPQKTGSISVTLREQQDNEPIAGAELSVYHIATVVMDADGDLIYDYTEDFEQFDTAVDDTLLVAKLDTYVSQHSVSSAKVTTNAQGTALCEALPLGLYFVKQTGAVEGFSRCTPFLVTVPNKKDDEYVYEVNASPKTEVLKLTSITIKKVWNTDASTEAADHVTVQLLNAGNVVKTATLNKDNDWQITYDNMPQSDAYSVKEVGVPKGFTATYKQNGYVFTVTNTAALIQTGQLVWPISVLAISGMLLIAVGSILWHKKREINA